MGLAPSVLAEPLCKGLAGWRFSAALRAVVHPHQAALDVSGTQPAQRFGLPGTRLVVDSRQAGYGGVTTEDQVGQGSAGEVRGRYSLPRVAARGRQPACGVVGHSRHPVAWHAQGPSPRVSEPRAFEGGEPFLRRATQHLVCGLVLVVLVFYARAIVVGRPAAPEEYAPVGGAREVVHGVAVGRHALAALPADLLPLPHG